METKKTLYRYRPLDVTTNKDVAEELKNQEIFLGTLEENNDPMDGFQNVYWSGDKVIWNNFIRHYCLCLIRTFCFLPVLGNKEEFNPSWINTRKTVDDFGTNELKKKFESFFYSVRQDKNITNLKKTLVKKKLFQKEELSSLLFMYHTFFISLLFKSFKEDIKSPKVSTSHLPKNLHRIIEKIPNNHLHVLSEISNEINEEMLLLHLYKNKIENPGFSIANGNMIKFITYFPDYYLSASIRDVYDEYYLACFSKHKDSVSMWGHYAQGHQGICLVFEFTDNFLELKNKKKITLYKVEYNEKPPDINLFEGFGYLTEHSLKNNWLTHKGEVSQLSQVYREKYHKRYWDLFTKKVKHKFPDWHREDEFRVVQSSWFIGRQKPEDRIYNYNFKHLRGVIFGMRTPLTKQMEIIKILDESLSADMKKKFKFYKARYSSIKNKMEIKHLKFFKLI